MADPVLANRTKTTISITWSALTGTASGDSTILSYNLYWDNGSGTTSIQLTDSLTTSWTVSGVVSGQSYKFKVRARNIYGYGSFSNAITI